MSTTATHSPIRTALLRSLGGVALAGVMAGCTAEIRAERPVVYAAVEADVVYTDYVPVNVQTYPRERYGGMDVYLVGGRWYRHNGSRWQTYRTEPVELGRRRAIHERRSPRPTPQQRERGHRN